MDTSPQAIRAVMGRRQGTEQPCGRFERSPQILVAISVRRSCLLRPIEACVTCTSMPSFVNEQSRPGAGYKLDERSAIDSGAMVDRAPSPRFDPSNARLSNRSAARSAGRLFLEDARVQSGIHDSSNDIAAAVHSCWSTRSVSEIAAMPTPRPNWPHSMCGTFQPSPAARADRPCRSDLYQRASMIPGAVQSIAVSWITESHTKKRPLSRTVQPEFPHCRSPK